VEENQITRVPLSLCSISRNLILNRGLQDARPATNIPGPNTAQPIYGKLISTIKIISLHTSQCSNDLIFKESVSVKGYVNIKERCVLVTSSLC
jgi:hypothetical protein